VAGCCARPGYLDVLQAAFLDRRSHRSIVLGGAVVHQRQPVGLGIPTATSDGYSTRCAYAAPALGVLHLLPAASGRALADPHSHEQSRILIFLIDVCAMRRAFFLTFSKVAVHATEKQLITERRADGIVDRLSERDSMAGHSHRTIQDPEVCHGAPHIRTLRNRCEPVAVKAACRAYAWLQARRAA
jgi:hypothetical protein